MLYFAQEQGRSMKVGVEWFSMLYWGVLQARYIQMYSDNESELASQREKAVVNIFGMYFCANCKNMLVPQKANGHILELLCHTCGPQTIDFSSRVDEECMLYSKELHVGTKKYVAEQDYIFDPTMPSVKVECPECLYDRAVYFLMPDEGETKIIAKMICASSTGTTAKCGNIWDLEDTSELLRTRVEDHAYD